jgi:hypothetical protein
LIDIAKSSRAVKHALLKEKDFGVADSIAPLIDDDSGNERARSEGKADVLGVEARANGDGGGEALVLMKGLVRVAAAGCRQTIFIAGEACEEEAAADIGQEGLLFVGVSDGSDSDLGTFERVAGDRVDDDSGDAIGGGRGRRTEVRYSKGKKKPKKSNGAECGFLVQGATPPPRRVRD